MRLSIFHYEYLVIHQGDHHYLFHQEFYDRLLNDYFDGDKTVIVSTHQVEEIETLLTELIFIDQGRIVLDIGMEAIADRFVEVRVGAAQFAELSQLKPIYTRDMMGLKSCIFENTSRDKLSQFGELHTPAISDLFVAKMKSQKMAGGAAPNE